MAYVQSFEPICEPSATCLILGSMPGKASLGAVRYYAHPRNLFWPLMGALVGASPDLEYETRLKRLKASGIALWDVLKSCRRGSSLDSDIDDSTIIPNDFPAFLGAHPHIRAVFFNGAKAESSFRTYVLPTLEAMQFPALHYQRLPSTSPANASIPYEKKLEAWKEILNFLSVLPTHAAVSVHTTSS